MTLSLARQSFLGPESDRVLATLSVAVVGLGGGGSHVSQQLAHLGVGRPVLIDPDRVEDTNLNRLVGATSADVQEARQKATIAERVYAGVNPAAHIIAIPARWQEHADVLRHCAVVVGCVDSFAERDQLERAARRYLTPYVDIGMDVHDLGAGYAIAGQVAVSLPEGPCMRCMGVLREDRLAEEAVRYGAGGARPQVVWPNGVLASLAVGLVVQLVTPWHANHAPPLLLEYDGNAHEVRRSSVLAYLPTRCPHFGAVEDLGDPWFGTTPTS